MADIERLETVLTHIKDHPETWDQTSWGEKTDCGTSYCFAGTAAVMFDKDNVRWERVIPSNHDWLMMIPPKGDDGKNQSWIHYGADLLDLTPEEAVLLFSGGNSLEDLEAYVKGLANGEAITNVLWQSKNLHQ